MVLLAMIVRERAHAMLRMPGENIISFREARVNGARDTEGGVRARAIECEIQ